MDIKELFQEMKNLVSDYSNGYYLYEELPTEVFEKFTFEGVYDELEGTSRWSNLRKIVQRVQDKHNPENFGFFEFTWDEPATEMQGGQETNLKMRMVEPYEVTVIKYREVMNFEQFAIKWLTERGMFESQAEEVLEMVKKYQTSMNGRWQDDISGYPAIMQNAIAISLKSTGLDWIKENKPMAFYRPIFED